jgi:hypothetical protein
LLGSAGAFTTLSASGNASFNTGSSGGIVSGTSTYSGYLSAVGGGSGATINITPNTVSGANGVDYNTSFVGGGNGPHNFKIGGTTYAVVSSTGLAVTGALSSTTGANFATSSGSVGVGTASPTSKLTVAGAMDASYPNLVGQAYIISTDSMAVDKGGVLALGGSFTGTTATTFASLYGRKENATDSNFAGYLAFLTRGASDAGTEKMRITSTGNVGIGTTSPNAKLTVSSAGGGNTNGLALTNSASGGGSYGLWVTATANGEGANKLIFADYTAGVNRMTLDGSGNLLVGTTSTSGNAGFQFLPNSGGAVASIDHVSGTATGAFYYSYNYNGLSIGSISQVGTTAVLYNTSSDYRLKDITGALTDSGTFIDALKPKVGTWKADGSKFVGFVAHEFAEVSPSSVTGEKDAVDSDGKPVYQAMQASSAEVIANLVAELKSLRQRVAALENSN